MTTTLRITGMHCASCKTLLEDVCSEFAGVRACQVDMATGQAVIQHDAAIDTAALIREIDQLGDYRATIL